MSLMVRNINARGRSFAIQIPLALVCLALAKFQLPLDGTPNHQADGEKLSFRDVDYAGIGLFAGGISTFILALEFGKDRFGWKSPIVISLAVASFIFIVAFVLAEKYTKRRPMVSSGLLSAPGIKTAYLIQILLFTATYNVSLQSSYVTRRILPKILTYHQALC